MIYYKNNKYHMCAEKVKYIQHGEEITQYVMSEGHDWWVDFEQKWEHTEIIEFIPVVSTDEQINRLEEVNQLNIKEGFGYECSQYIEFGIFPEGFNHILRPIQILKQQEEQDKYLIDLDFRQTLNEMGVDTNDL